MHSFRSGISHIIVFSVTVLLLLSSCNRHGSKPGPSGFADESFSEELSEILQPLDTTEVDTKSWSLSQDMRLVYQMDEYQPVWVKENYAANDAADRLITELEDMQWDGADVTGYKLSYIKDLKTKLDTNKKNTVADAIAFDTTLTKCYLAAARFLLFGVVNPRKVDSLWHHKNDTVWNAPELLVNGDDGGYPSLNDFRSQFPSYELLRTAYRHYYSLLADSSYLNAIFNLQEPDQSDSVLWLSIGYVIQTEQPWLNFTTNDSMSERTQLIRAFQTFKSLKVTGRLDSATMAELATGPDVNAKRIYANMERMRWMQRTTGDMYVVVNIPFMELFFHKDGQVVMNKRVIVGKKARQTPSLFANMTNIVINPPWGVPPTILKNDVLPGIQKSGSAYLAKKGLKVYDHNGKLVNVATINAKNYKRYTYRQAPGSDNSLGYVKFNMPNKWDIYLHDTPHREDFEKRDRALSSGCVRVHNPQEMALYILSGIEEKTRYTQGRLDTIIRTHKTRSESLNNKIPVFITYLTIYEDNTGNHIRFGRDIYGRDAKLLAYIN